MLIISHGVDQAGINSAKNPTPTPPNFYWVAKEFLERGYSVIVPMRQGMYGSSGQFDYDMCDIGAHSKRAAADLAAVINHLAKQDQVDANNIVLAGQSYGAIVMLALLAEYPEEAKLIKGAINFSGGLLHNTKQCPWNENRLTNVIENYAAKIKLRNLWIYTEDDQLFSKKLTEKMRNAYS